MIADLGRYTDYRDSEQIWLGEMPAHWKISRLGARLYERRETNERNEIQHVLSVMKGRGVIPYTEKGNVGNKRSDDIRRYKIVRPDDIVINCMNVIIGSLGISKYTGCLSPVYYVLRTRFDDDVPRYFNSVFQTANFHRSLVRIGNGILAHRMRIPMEKLKCEMIPVPPPDEQELIVRFLDWASVRLGKAIAAKRKVIGLLEEQKQAIIHRAVTRGLDDTFPLKPSGLDWLGDVPEHWDTISVRRVVSFVTSGSRGWSEYFSESGDLFLQSGNLGRSMQLDLTRLQYVRPPRGAEGERTQVQKDDVLICVTGALTGNVAHVDCEPEVRSYINQHVALLRPQPNLVAPRFLAFALHSKIGAIQFKASEYGGTKQGLGLGDVKAAVVTLPSLDEQIRICEILDSEISKFKASLSVLGTEIRLLQEYRTRLIADVVTGKLDVREFACTLPADIAEEVAELASSELGDEEFSDADDDMADEFAGEPA